MHFPFTIIKSFTAALVLLVTFVLLISFNSKAQSVVINEIMSSNSSVIMDEDGDYEDWFELYNESEFPINLNGYFISDNSSNPLKWTFPEVSIAPGEFLLVFASGKNRSDSPILHTNFSLSIDGEPLILSNPVGEIIDYFEPVQLTTNNSFGRFPDGQSNTEFFQGSTPGFSNNTLSPIVQLPDNLQFSHEQGLYSNEFELFLFPSNPESSIYYTLNGSDPDPDDFLYSDFIEILDNTHLPNILSTIPTTDSGAMHPYHWQPPTDTIFKGTVLKVRTYENGQPTSPIYTKTYFVHENIFEKYNNLPLISIVTDSINLFSYETGIYVPGISRDEELHGIGYWGYGNFFGRGMEWERPANITLFEGDGSIGFQQNVGVRIHGGSTRSLPIKSLRLYARNLYGDNKFDYAFFPWKNVTQFKNIILRQSGNDFTYNYCGDALSSLLVKDFNIDRQDYRPSVLFINGEFWGVINIRDRIDNNFLEYTHSIDPTEHDINYMTSWAEASVGTTTAFANLLDFVEDSDLSDSDNYEYVISQIDINSFIDYYIAKTYTAVYDWPGNNIAFWRSNNGVEETLWRWVFLDNDNAFFDPTFDAIEHATMIDGPFWPNPEISTLLFRRLLENEEFLALFLEKFEFHLLNSFSNERVNKVLDSVLFYIEPVMHEHINRWQYPASYNSWQEEIQIIRDFAEQRPCYMIQHLHNHFGISYSNFADNMCDTIPESQATVPEVFLWPNPASHHLNIQTPNYQESIQHFTIYDALGRLMLHKSFPENQIAHYSSQISISNYSEGTYTILIQTANRRYNKKFVVIR